MSWHSNLIPGRRNWHNEKIASHFHKGIKGKNLIPNFLLNFSKYRKSLVEKTIQIFQVFRCQWNPLLYFPVRKNANSGVSNRSSWWLQFWHHDSSFISFLTISKLMCMLSGNTWHNHHYHEGISIWQPHHNTDFHIQFSKWDDTGSFVCYCFTW